MENFAGVFRGFNPWLMELSAVFNDKTLVLIKSQGIRLKCIYLSALNFGLM